MLTGIKAFEACWSAIKQTYPTSRTENNLLVQSMGRFVDKYATREEIRNGLPKGLQNLFDRLVDAYLRGYEPAPSTPANVQAAQVIKTLAKTQPTPIGCNETLIAPYPTTVADPVDVPDSVVSTVSAVPVASKEVADVSQTAAATSTPRMTAATMAVRDLRRTRVAVVDRNEAATLVIEDLDR